MATAIEVLDRVRARKVVPDEDFGAVVARMSFFVNAGVRFVEEMCKMRAFVDMWDTITQERYGVLDAKQRRFRYGVQVNSLGLSEAQPENNVYRIMLEMLGVTLSKDARARAVQLPAWNEALGLPRPWDQQWSLRMQQVLAYETDLLEYDDLFTGSPVVEAKVKEIVEDASAELDTVLEMGGAVAAVESGYMKQQLVGSLTERRARIESGDDVVVGLNAFELSEPSPLQIEGENAVYVVDPAVEAEAVDSLVRWRAQRSSHDVDQALRALQEAASGDGDLMAPSLACARAGVTTGEWAGALRAAFGEYRAPTGIDATPAIVPRGEPGTGISKVAARVRELSTKRGRPYRFLVGKPGLDGHSNGAEQIAVRARDAGFEVIYQGIRLTPEQIVDAAVAEDVDVIGLSILSGSHRSLVPAVLQGLREAGASDIPVVVGGIIPAEDEVWLREQGVSSVFTPKDYDVAVILNDVVDLLAA
jgi:(2R)-ethylmalonyl-CoA mutase